ncbi:hypothetical protein HPP92_010009 [Vanilla planifolia]|uniref:Uncharacterized protein n=1 Tax=Vanilla planifolia TaxID=51239 RepID=A0A835R5J6_VANPL|nr:hypothetical protein HPP92_010009 [Vanilla planifolia]
MKKKKKKPSGDSASWIRASPLHQLRPSIPIMWSSQFYLEAGYGSLLRFLSAWVFLLSRWRLLGFYLRRKIRLLPMGTTSTEGVRRLGSRIRGDHRDLGQIDRASSVQRQRLDRSPYQTYL